MTVSYIEKNFHFNFTPFVGVQVLTPFTYFTICNLMMCLETDSMFTNIATCCRDETILALAGEKRLIEIGLKTGWSSANAVDETTNVQPTSYIGEINVERYELNVMEKVTTEVDVCVWGQGVVASHVPQTISPRELLVVPEAILGNIGNMSYSHSVESGVEQVTPQESLQHICKLLETELTTETDYSALQQLEPNQLQGLLMSMVGEP